MATISTTTQAPARPPRPGAAAPVVAAPKAAGPTPYARLVARHGDRQVLLVGVAGPAFKPMRAFRDHARALTGPLGFPQDRVATTATGFATPFAQNADALAATIRQRYAQAGNVPVVAVGNPTTGVDLLLALLRHPDLVEKGMVDRAVLVQPAIGTPLLGNLPWPLSRLAIAEKNDPANARPALEAALATFPAHLRPALDQTVRYVRGGAPASDTNPLFWLPTKLLARRGANDGVSLVADQQLAGVGRDLAVRMDADHWDLVMSAPAADSKAPTREAFMAEVLRGLYP